uniref:HECT-type E3 ubiquitin transferase n=1 Tax=Rhabditophanes sp. KR3021 TaxID=114890 RepID=A0AC35TPT4_9BILA
MVCHLYQNTIKTFPNIYIDIYSGITTEDVILPALWTHINNEGKSMRFYLKMLQTDEHCVSEHASTIILFCNASVSILNMLDEKEMYEIQKPFELSQLAEIAKFANLFCFNAIWRKHLVIKDPKSNPIFDAVYQLLSVLYSCDMRRSFTSHIKKFWIAPDVKSNFLISQFESNESNAKFMLNYMSHLIPLLDRVDFFRRIVAREKENYSSPTMAITIERSHLIEDGYRQLNNMNPKELRNTIRIKFINAQGLDEAGIDRDGVFKEFLELTLKKVFDPQLNLFITTENNYVFPSPTSSIHDEHLQLFTFVGKMLAKAVYEGIVTDLQIAPVLLSIIANKKLSGLTELSQLDPPLYKSLTYLKHYKDSDDVADLDLTFSVDEDRLGTITTVDLIPGGRHVNVTNENKIRYIHTMANYKVFKQTREQNAAFVRGFQTVLDQTWLNFFSPHEIQYLIAGNSDDFNISDLRYNTHYYGGFHSNHKVIKWLWDILENDFTNEERHLFIKFITSCSQPPILGFKYLNPQFSIRCVEANEDEDPGDTLASVVRGFFAIKKKVNATRLPTASTCFNLLKLPNYSRRSILLDKLRYAIHADTGFENI